MENKDIVIIGAGPAGLSAAIYVKRSGLSFSIIDGNMPGGKVNTATKIDNYLGLGGLSGSEMAYRFFEHANELEIEVTNDNVLLLEKNDDGFLVKCRENTFKCKAVIIATGLINSKLGIKGENEFFGRGVSYCATCDGNFFKEKDVAVIGDDEIANNEVLYLSSLCNNVYFFTKQNSFDFVFPDNVKIEKNREIIEILGDFHVKSVKLSDDSLLEVSGVFPVGKEKIELNFIKSIDLIREKEYICCNSKQETSIKGIYAAGDVTDRPLKQIITAAGDGAVAASSAIKFVKGARKL